jgi:hypothetical protein
MDSLRASRESERATRRGLREHCGGMRSEGAVFTIFAGEVDQA